MKMQETKLVDPHLLDPFCSSDRPAPARPVGRSCRRECCGFGDEISKLPLNSQ